MKQEEKPQDPATFNRSLQKIVKGTGFVFVGILANYFFLLISGVILARHWTEYEIGIYSLVISLVTIGITISVLGMNQGVVRSIAHAIGRNEHLKIPDFIFTSLFISIINSLILGAFLFFASEFIAINIFNEPLLTDPIKIISLTLPFYVANTMIVSIFRGYEVIKPTVYFKYIIETALPTLFFIIVISLDLPFIYVFYSIFLTGVINLSLIVIYSLVKSKRTLNISFKSIFSPAAKELVAFSTPLFVSAALWVIIFWISTLLLGSLKGAAAVGFYQVSRPFAAFISFPLTAMALTFVPVFSGLYAKGLIKEMKNNYRILTKWICLITLPIFLVFFLFPELTITVLLGPNYVPSTTPLRILSLSYIILNFMGPCNSTLISIGKSRFILIATGTGAILSVVLSYLLIPAYSYDGAALSLGITFLFVASAETSKVYLSIKAQPIGPNLIKPTLLMIAIVIPFYLIFKNIVPTNFFYFILLFVIFYLIYILSFLVSKSMDQTDLELLDGIEQKTGIKTTIIKKIIMKFQ